MITLLRNLWYSRETRNRVLCDKLEDEQKKLDLEIEEENINVDPTSCLKNVIIKQSNTTTDDNSEKCLDVKCFKRTGKQKMNTKLHMLSLMLNI